MRNPIRMIRFTPILAGLLLSLAAGAAAAKLFVPDSEAWAIWEQSDEASAIAVDHSVWQELLIEYLITETEDGIYRFDYAAVTDSDAQRLKNYLAGLARIEPPALARAEQKAYWINLYNALTVQVVLENYPVKSIRKIYGGLFNTGPWDESLIEVAGQTLTLNDIEHRILRPVWRDPRIHYGVNCASLGCPNLAAQAYTGANVDALLDDAARAFINHSRAVSFDGDRLMLSSIYDWFDIDFGKNRAERLKHLQEFAAPELARRLEDYDGRIRYDYDWRLNER